MTLVRLVLPREIPLLELQGYRAVCQRGRFIEMELRANDNWDQARDLAADVVADFMGSNS